MELYGVGPQGNYSSLKAKYRTRPMPGTSESTNLVHCSKGVTEPILLVRNLRLIEKGEVT